ncbi:hypothetical protein AAEP80_11160 [Curtobacterium sp. L3-7]
MGETPSPPLTPDSGITASGELDNLPVDAESAAVRADLDAAAGTRGGA